MKTLQEIQLKLSELKSEKLRLTKEYEVNALGFRSHQDIEVDENFDEDSHQREIDVVSGQIQSLEFVLS